MSEPAQKRRKGGIETLNVGGVRSVTTRETLEMLPYFRALFQQEDDLGRKVQTDDDGNLFVDRNGDLFKIIIEYLRTLRRPPKEVLVTHGIQLRDEADFYGCSELLNELDGLTNPVKLEQRDRELREADLAITHAYQNSDSGCADSWEEELIDVFKTSHEFTIHARSELGYPLLYERKCLLPPVGSRSIFPNDIANFEARFKEFSGAKLLDVVGKDPAVVIAGGSVVAALVEEVKPAYRESGSTRDVDVFLCGVTPERAQTLLDEILERFKPMIGHTVVVRSNAAVTMLTMGMPRNSAPLQVMLTLYRDPLEVVLNFDIDSCGALYHPHSRRVFCTRRCQRAFNFRANVVDTDLRSDLYERRLDKYARRGFCVAVPGLDASHIDGNLLTQSYMLVLPLNHLLRLGPEQAQEKVEMTHKPLLRGDMDVIGLSGSIKVTKERSAVIVPHSLQRMLILDRLGVKEVTLPMPEHDPRKAERPPEGFRFTIPADGPEGAVTWISFPDVDHEHSGSDLSRFIQQLHFEHLLSLPPQADNLEGLPASQLQLDYHTLLTVNLARLQRGKPLGFVFARAFHLREPLTSTAQLPYIHDAEREPLRTDLSDAEFESRYGVRKLLAFTPLGTHHYAKHGRRAVHAKLRAGTAHPQRPFMQGVYAFAP